MWRPEAREAGGVGGGGRGVPGGTPGGGATRWGAGGGAGLRKPRLRGEEPRDAGGHRQGRGG